MPSDSSSQSAIDALIAKVAPYKGMLSECGWAYLINDTNNFLSYLCGGAKWSDQQRQQAAEVIRQRHNVLAARGIAYCKFVIPEKGIVYPEYLPAEIRALLSPEPRPAQLLQADCPNAVLYLDCAMLDAKPIAHIYFRADSHPNWLGAWFVYRSIFHRLQAENLIGAQKAIDLREMDGAVASYDGDLMTQVPQVERELFALRYGHTIPRYGFEMAISLSIRDDCKRAFAVEAPEIYREWYSTRETLAYERADKAGPRAVIFRDSTFDRGVVELLAQHFSRSVFVWHQGQVDRDVIDREAPDLVIHAMAERFLSSYPSTSPFIRVSGVPEGGPPAGNEWWRPSGRAQPA